LNDGLHIRRELVQIIGEINHQLGAFSKPVRDVQTKATGFQNDFEKLISEKCAQLTETQKFKIAENMRIHRICSIF
jgi:hypothetical protein